MHDHHDHVPHGPGHNGAGPRQWQTPHLPHSHDHAHGASTPEPDIDLVERAFLEAFPATSDPTSFLRLAGIPFTGRSGDGRTLRLLRVEASHRTDVGALTPHLGGSSHRYDPLPAKMTSRRATLTFVYFDGTGPTALTFAEARALEAE